jgi:WD40 repeat protein
MPLFSGDPLIDPFGSFPGTGINHIKVSPDGSRLLAAGSNGGAGIAALFNTSGEALGSFGDQLAPVFTANYSGDGNHIVTAAYDGSVAQWTSDGALIRKSGLEQAALCDAEYLRNGNLLVASDNGSTSIWTSRGKEQSTFLSDGTTRAVTTAADGKRLASASDSGNVHLFNSDGEHIRSFETGGARINSLRFSENSKRILISTYNGFAKVFTLKGVKKLAIRATDDGITNQATYRPGSNQIATAGADGFVRFWSARGEALNTVAMPGSSSGAGAQSLAFAPDGEQLFVAMTDRSLWELS